MQVDSTAQFTPRTFGKYLLLDRVGRGGMAEVFRAKTYGPAGFVKECAIKRILSSLLDDEQFVQMFVDEARVTSFLTHANIVQVLELSELEGHLFIAMEYVPGKDLLDLLARSARRGLHIPRDVVLHIAIEMLKGLDFAHSALDAQGNPIHIVHRDVSPSNILLSYDGQVKVGDFGIAKSGLQTSHTEIGTQKGKTGYMSPEQVTGDTFDHRSDIFAATTILFEMLTMSRLFKAPNDLDVMLKIRDADIEADFERTRDLPESLVDVLRIGLARRMEDRFATAGEMRLALEDVCAEEELRPGSDRLAAFIQDLFADRYKAEMAARASDPISAEGFEAFAAANQNLPRFRYRDHEGVIHGPMNRGMLEELVGSRKPNDAERVSVEGQAWVRVSEVPEVARVARPGVAMLPAASERRELDAHDLRVEKGVYDWEDLSLAGINPKKSRRARRDDGETPSPPAASPREPSPPAPSPGAAPAEPAPAPADVEPERASPGRMQPRATTPAVPVEAAGETDPLANSGASPGSPARPISAPLRAIPRREYERPSLTFSPTEAEKIRRAASEDAGAPDVEGPIGVITVTRLLHRLVHAGATGRLRLEGAQEMREVYLIDGRIVAIDSTVEADRLGHLLIDSGLVNEDDLMQALEHAKATGMQLGDALVSLRKCAPHELYHALQEQLREKLAAALFWTDVVWSWWDEPEIATGPFPLAIEEMDAIVDAVFSRPRTAYFREFYRERAEKHLVRTDVKLDPEQVHLSSKAMRLEQHIAKGQNVRDVITQFADRYGWKEREVYQTLYLLTEFEVFRFKGERTPPLPG